MRSVNVSVRHDLVARPVFRGESDSCHGISVQHF